MLRPPPSALQTAQPLVDDAKSTAQQVVSDAKDQAIEAAQQVKESAADKAGTVKDDGTIALSVTSEGVDVLRGCKVTLRDPA